MTKVVDVRSPEEFERGHVPGAVNIPLPHLSQRLADLSKEATLTLVCWSGQRASAAADLLQGKGYTCSVLAGGTKRWMEEGHAVVATRASGWALERQIRFAMGLIVIAFSGAALLGATWGAPLALAVGIAATLTSMLGICPMGSVLMRMPWNRQG
jgi:rhodanese-related sulfurtransferase